MSEFFDKTLHYLGRKGFKPSIVVIGAMDGISFDEMVGYIRMYQWSGLFVEPIEHQFLRLRKYYDSLEYRPDNRYENCAVSSKNGTLEMITIDSNAVDEGAVHPCFGGMSAVFPPRNGLGSPGDADVVRRFGRTITVPCLTLPTLLQKHDVRHIDVLQVDAEGHDWIILQQLDLTLYRPKLVRSERVNLDEAARQAMLDHFANHGYLHVFYGQEIDFVDQHFWNAIAPGH